ncbi:hypothetical protein AHAS_Ahas17G0226900 [Arachis hypogaea]
MMDTKEMEDLPPLDENQPPHSWDGNKQIQMVLDDECLPEGIENPEETEATKHTQPQLQPHTTNMEEQCAIDVDVNQPPQLESSPQPSSQPLPQPWL